MNKYNDTLQKEYDRLENQNVFSYDDMKIKSKYTWTFGADNFSSLGEVATKTRTVRDIPIN